MISSYWVLFGQAMGVIAWVLVLCFIVLQGYNLFWRDSRRLYAVSNILVSAYMIPLGLYYGIQLANEYGWKALGIGALSGFFVFSGIFLGVRDLFRYERMQRRGEFDEPEPNSQPPEKPRADGHEGSSAPAGSEQGCCSTQPSETGQGGAVSLGGEPSVSRPESTGTKPESADELPYLPWGDVLPPEGYGGQRAPDAGKCSSTQKPVGVAQPGGDATTQVPADGSSQHSPDAEQAGSQPPPDSRPSSPASQNKKYADDSEDDVIFLK